MNCPALSQVGETKGYLEIQISKATTGILEGQFKALN